MNNFLKLTKKEILNRHKKNQQDKALHTTIETKGVKKDAFNKLIEESIKQEPFDKKKEVKKVLVT